MSKAKEEKVLNSETIFEGEEFKLRRDTVELPSGKTWEQPIVERPDEVILIPQVSNAKIIMIRQYRRGIKEVLLELPGGKVRVGESEEEAANRELEEEVGYKAEKLVKIGENYIAPSWVTSRRIFFLAQGLTENPKAPDPDENIEIVKISLQEALAKAQSSKIKDSKSVLGLLLAKDYLRGSTP